MAGAAAAAALTALCLSDYRGGERAEALVEAVAGCRRLQELRLRGFGGAGLPPLPPTLTALRLVECGVHALPGAPDNEGFDIAAPRNPQILDLEISEPGVFPAWPPGGGPLLARLQRLVIWGLRSAELPAHVAALTDLTSLALLDSQLQVGQAAARACSAAAALRCVALCCAACSAGARCAGRAAGTHRLCRGCLVYSTGAACPCESLLLYSERERFS